MNKNLFTCGHFDLIICDEAHPSIYNKYEIFLIILMLQIVDLQLPLKMKSIKYHMQYFELEENGVPHGYELAQAVKDGYFIEFV